MRVMVETPAVMVQVPASSWRSGRDSKPDFEMSDSGLFIRGLPEHPPVAYAHCFRITTR